MNKIQSKLKEKERPYQFQFDGEEESLYISVENEQEIVITRRVLGFRMFIPSDQPFEPPEQFMYATEDEVLNKLGC